MCLEWPFGGGYTLSVEARLHPLPAPSVDSLKVAAPSNQRMKLTWRGGRSIGKESLLIAAATLRSLCAIR